MTPGTNYGKDLCFLPGGGVKSPFGSTLRDLNELNMDDLQRERSGGDAESRLLLVLCLLAVGAQC